MAKWWLGVALIVGGAGMAAPVRAQLPPGPPISGGMQMPPAYGSPGCLQPNDGPAGMLPLSYPTGTNAFKEEVNNDPPPCPPDHCYINADYLLWRLKSTGLPALVNTGSLLDPIPGANGQPGTQELIGGGVTTNTHSGVRLTAGVNLGEDQCWGVEGSGFILEQRTAIFKASSDGSPGSLILSRPFFNPVTGTEDADPISRDNIQAGDVGVFYSDRFLGGELDVRYGSAWTPVGEPRYGILVGTRILSLWERLGITEHVNDLPGSGDTNSFTINDEFITRNTFVGAQVGAYLDVPVGPLTFSGVGKFAAGSVFEISKIRGDTTILTSNGTVFYAPNEGLLAQPTNVYRLHRTRFAWVPEVGGTVNWQVSQSIRFSLGYTFLYWSDAARPSGQIDKTVNIQPLNTPALTFPLRPAANLTDTDFYVHGLNLGLEFSF